ncbi:MAG: bifunctional diaminohydroxyphosphoribosylaminopyrimidine deaminase/5-amino-6-(5-phosphoribosylamino)uracil reductase RibD, partial [Candidatus Omnitrophica bacterium]|nr:bifunctional diaminohydroxyphosphoribosylaminopyrimidine deaminase/5-amino-6-(5-phosphoribosylamino)uracil reductase RibD [Candidatus Omnitrophota bacterium]
MRLALELAGKALGDTSPNPVVGAVIVKGGRVVGRGYHRRAGLPHAEVEALRDAGKQARGATMFVTLEPCAHTGRTPPCCEAIITAGIRRVVVAMADPNPRTDGRGIAWLRRAGIQVLTGVLKEEAGRLNEPFTKYITKRLPWVIVKIAQTLDGKIATRTGESRWISSAASRELAHRLRRQVDAIVVGVNTV